MRWFAADDLPALAFDHNVIVEYALWRLRTKMEYSRIAHAFLGETFTLAQLREVHEAVLGKPLDPANFRRTIEGSGAVVPTDEHLTGTPHRPPRLYRYNDSIDLADAGPLPRQQHPFERRERMSTTASVDTTIQLIARGELDGETCTPDLVEAPWMFDGGPAVVRPRRLHGRPDPRQRPAPGRAARGVPHGVRRRTGCAHPRREGDPRRPRRRDSATSTSATRSCSTPTSSATRSSSRTRPRRKPEAEAIVFCGVHFMAETADILSRPEQAVILPNLAAGCSMADMADIDSVTECWEQLDELYGTEPDADGRVPVIPVTYMNSSAALKAFCGEHGGIVCTSSNAATVLKWAFERGQRVLFFPDQHLGRNTAKAMGVPRRADAALESAQAAGRHGRGDARRTPTSSSGTASARCTSASRSARSSTRGPSSPASA